MINTDTSSIEKIDEDELFCDIDNKDLKFLLNNKLFKFFSNNTSNKIAFSTIVITMGSFFVKILIYMRLKGYLSFFSISTDSVGISSDHGLYEFLINGIIFLGIAIAISLCYILIESFLNHYKLMKMKYLMTKNTFLKKLELFFSNIKNLALLTIIGLFIIESINFLLLICIVSGKLFFTFKLFEYFYPLLYLTIIEIITTVILIFFNSIKIKNIGNVRSITKDQEEIEAIKKTYISSQKNFFVEATTSFIVLLFFFYSTLAYVSGTISAQDKKSFPIIGSNYAVIYQDQQNYWLIESKEQNEDILLLNTSSQKILGVSGISVKIKTYEEVVIKNK